MKNKKNLRNKFFISQKHKCFSDKKGFWLAKKVLGIIIAIICILVLIYLVYRVYSTYDEKNDIEMAKASLEVIEDGLRRSEIDVGGKAEFIITGPKNWWITYWPMDNKLPSICVNSGWENCICICNSLGSRWTLGGDYYGSLDNFISSCDKNQICIKPSMHVSLDETGNAATHSEFMKKFLNIGGGLSSGGAELPIKLCVQKHLGGFVVHVAGQGIC